MGWATTGAFLFGEEMKSLWIVTMLVCLLGCGRTKNEVIVLGLGIEKIGETYTVHAEVGQVKRVKEEDTIQYVMGEGESLEEAFSDVFEKSGSSFYFSHVQVIALNHRMARDLEELKEYFKKYSELPYSSYLFISNSVSDLFSDDKENQSIRLSQLCEYRESETGIKMILLEDLFLEDMMLFSVLDTREEEYVFGESVLLLMNGNWYEIGNREAFLLGSALQKVDTGLFEGEDSIYFDELYTYVENGTLFVHGVSEEMFEDTLVDEIKMEYMRIISEFDFMFKDVIENVEVYINRGNEE